MTRSQAQIKSPETHATKRVVYLDLLRLVATFQMLQGHAIDAVLHPVYRQGPVHALWQVVRGYTAPAFLFAAGFAFYLTTLRGMDARPLPTAKTHWRRIRRFVLLIALGYLMHMPPSLGQVWEYAIVDVLQCIGVSLLVLELLVWRWPHPRMVVSMAGVLAIASFALEPALADWTTSGALRVLSNYINHAGGSLFPVVPHGGYVFAGVCTGALVASNDDPTRHLRPLLVVAVVSWLVVVGLAQLQGAEPVRLERLAVVLSTVAALAWMARPLRRLAWQWSTFASQTLVIYLVHVGALYADPWGVQAWLGPVLGPCHSILFALIVVILSLLFALGWQRLTRRGTSSHELLEPRAPSR